MIAVVFISFLDHIVLKRGALLLPELERVVAVALRLADLTDSHLELLEERTLDRITLPQ